MQHPFRTRAMAVYAGICLAMVVFFAYPVGAG